MPLTPTFTAAAKDASNVDPADWVATVNSALAVDPAASRSLLHIEGDGAESQPVEVLDIPSPYSGTYGLTVTHPSVIRLPRGFNGYRYAMAYTPYGTPATSAIENPCIAYSHDKITWVVPDGLTNPLQSNADAVAAGLTFWSDPDIVYDEANEMLVVYYRGVQSNPSYGETIYRQTSTDGITWTAKVAVLSSAATTSAILSPSIVIESATDWLMFVNYDSSEIRRFRSTDAGLTFVADATPGTLLPAGLVPWHNQVRKYEGVYYGLIMTYVTKQIVFVYSTDGITFYGDLSPVLPPMASLDNSGGHYRSTFLPVGVNPVEFDVFATAMSGTVGDANHLKTHRVVYFRYRKDIINPVFNNSDMKVVNLEENYIGGLFSVTVPYTVGQTPFYFINGAGTGSVTPAQSSNDFTFPGIGGVILSAGATAANISGIQDTVQNWSFQSRFMMLMNRFSYKIWFKLATSGAGDTMWIGFGSHNLTGSEPTRFLGITATVGTDTNFQYACRATGTAKIDSGLAIDTAWHVFEIRKSGGKWIQTLDGAYAVATTNPFTDVGMNLSKYVMSGSAGAARLHLGKERLFGVIP